MQDNATGPGNVRQIERMMRIYGTPLLRMCHAYLRNAALAEDAAQDTFLKAYQNLDGFRNEGELSEKAWLMRIAINTCRDYRRRVWFKNAECSVPFEHAGYLPTETDEDSIFLADEIAALPNKLKEVLLLHYYHSLSYDEIAALLRISRSTVYAGLEQAREKLRKGLEGGDRDGR